MVYSQGLLLTEDLLYMPMLSSTEVMELLGITKITLTNWIYLKKIKVHRYKIGKRIYNAFDSKEVERLKQRMVTKRQPGKSLLK